MIKDDYTQFAGFADIGSCLLHVVHNAFRKGIEKYGKEVDRSAHWSQYTKYPLRRA